MDYEKYAIEKGKQDLLSSLKGLNKKIIKEYLEEYCLDNIEELKDDIIDKFEFCLSVSKDDIFSQAYFKKLLEYENSMIMAAYNADIEALWVFIYENNGHYSYYIPTEIKKIIKNELNL